MKGYVTTRSLVFGDHHRTFLKFWGRRAKEKDRNEGSRRVERKGKEMRRGSKEKQQKERRKKKNQVLGAHEYGQSYTGHHKNSALSTKNNDRP